MGKVLITDTGATQAVPFLRGILTRSLQLAGLTFEDAYKLASDVRHDLASAEGDLEISSDKLQQFVQKQLRKKHGDVQADRYISPVASPATIFVTSRLKNKKPFSRGQFQHGLNPCCKSTEESMHITSIVYEHLLNLGVKEISSADLIALTEGYLRTEVGRKAAKRYLNWIEFQHSNRPLIVLISGVSGCGKSTIATELAHRLDIVRIQSTDMLREVMRLMIPERLMPVLHASSFDAWQMLPQPIGYQSPEIATDELLIQGYQAQADLVAVACEGAINRALEERVSLILEGVNIHPSLARKLNGRGDAIIVPIMLGVLQRNELMDRIKGRRASAPDRHTQHYLDNFDAICRMQSFLLSEADQGQVTVISNDDRETTVQEIMQTINHHLERSFAKK